MKLSKRLIFYKAIVSLAILVIASVLFNQYVKELQYKPTIVSIEIKSGEPDIYQIFYRTPKKGWYNEKNSVSKHYSGKGNQIITFEIHDKISKRFRIDPGTKEGIVKIKSICVQTGEEQECWSGNELIKAFTPLHHISEFRIKDNVLSIRSDGNDPHFESTFDASFFFIAQKNLLPSIIVVVFSLSLLIVVILFGARVYRFIYEEFIRHFQRKHFIWINALFTLVVFAAPPEPWLHIKYLFFFIIVFVLPGYLLLNNLTGNNIKFTFLTRLVSSIAVSISFFIVLLFFFDELSIKSNVYVLYLVPVSILLLVNFLKYRKIQFTRSVDSDSLWCWFILNIFLWVFIQPTKGLIVAPLHDPMANSYLGQFLINTSYSDLPINMRYYPPGMSYIVALFTDISSINSAKTVLITTNIFNVLSAFSFALFFSWFFLEKRMFPFLIFSFIILSGFVPMLYWSAGKNSQILSYFLASAALYLYIRAQYTRLSLVVLSFMLITAAILTHYNNIIIIGFFVPFIFLKANISACRFSGFLRKATYHILVALPFLGVLLLMIFRSAPDQGGVVVDSGESDSVIQSIIYSLSFDGAWSFLKTACYGRFTIIFTVLGILTSFVLFVVKKKARFAIFVVLLLMPYLYFVSHGDFGTISHYNRFNLFFIEVTLSGIFVYSVFLFLRIKWLKAILISILLLYSAYSLNIIHNDYLNARKFSAVVEADMIAFEWIKRNTPKNAYFLPATFARTDSNQQWYQIEGSLYLKVFSEREDALSFIPGDAFISKQDELRKHYKMLIAKPDNKNVLKYFLDKNIKYIYDGAHKPWGTSEIDPAIFERYSENFRLVYDSLGVKIYRIRLS